MDVNNILNKFHENIKFTNEGEHNGKISFLDVLLMKSNGKFETTVSRQKTNSDMFLHWRTLAPIT